MQEKPTLSIIIVTFNHETEIIPCLTAIRASEGDQTVEVIVVDNASKDQTVRQVTEFTTENSGPTFSLRLIASPENTGFTRGTNLGLKSSRGDFLLLLNPDTQVQPDALQKLISFLQSHPDVGIVAPQLRFPNGAIQPSCRRFPRRSDVFWQIFGLARLFPDSACFNRWKMGDFSHTEIAAVEQPQGAAVMTSRTAFAQIGLLDESFPMFFSDVDWCKRFVQKGLKIIFFPTAQVVHHKGSAIYRYRRAMIWSSHKSFIHYFQKHHTGVFNQLLNSGIALLLIPLAGFRILVGTISGVFKK
jgi:GT2 family glycosyltransferase